MKKFECNECTENCIIYRTDGGIPIHCVDNYGHTNWHEVKEDNNEENAQVDVKSEPLPKLTAKVFDRSDCPIWANYAVINCDGRLTFFSNKPKFEGEDYGCWSCNNSIYTHIDNTVFDASGWENSLIERPKKQEQLPDWVKVGAIGYNTHTNDYFEIVCINCTFNVVNVNLFNGGYLQYGYATIRKHCVQAQKRPFNDKEMREIVGKSLETPGFVKFIFSYDKENKTLESYDFLYTADDLFEDDFKFEGKPCYKLEHLNNNGEWVE